MKNIQMLKKKQKVHNLSYFSKQIWRITTIMGYSNTNFSFEVDFNGSNLIFQQIIFNSDHIESQDLIPTIIKDY